MLLQIADLALESLDAADVEAAALFIVDEDRPLRGLPGLCDWRMCGSLSRALAGGWYQGKPGETLLVPSRLGKGAMRVFVFGLGPAASLRGTSVLEDALARAFEALRKARISSCCFAVPWPGLELDPSLELWVKHRVKGPDRQLLLGEARQIQRWVEGAATRFPGLGLEGGGLPPSLRGPGGDGTITGVGRDRSEP